MRIKARLDEEGQKKKILSELLTQQMVQNKELSEASRQEEREKDLHFLSAAAQAQYVENMALRRKEEALK